jgi:hypothetical protein
VPAGGPKGKRVSCSLAACNAAFAAAFEHAHCGGRYPDFTKDDTQKIWAAAKAAQVKENDNDDLQRNDAGAQE